MPELDLEPRHLALVDRILAEHVPHCAVRVFGSRVAGTAKPFSDLDLEVKGTGPLEARTLRRLQEAFDESDLPIRVDVLDGSSIGERFRHLIDERSLLLREPTPRPDRRL